MKSTEFEVKKPLSREEYERLRAYMLPRGDEALQINYYYDTPTRDLRAHGINLRARSRHGNLSLEVKRHRRYEGNLRVCDEYPTDISALPSTVDIEIDGERLTAHLLGELATVRLDMRGDGYVASLDASYYLGRVDYELEVEIGSNRGLPREIVSLAGDFSEKVTSKYGRFLSALDETKKTSITLAIGDDQVKIKE